MGVLQKTIYKRTCQFLTSMPRKWLQERQDGSKNDKEMPPRRAPRGTTRRALTRRSRPDSGLDLQVQFQKTFPVLPSSRPSLSERRKGKSFLFRAKRWALCLMGGMERKWDGWYEICPNQLTMPTVIAPTNLRCPN